jgi:2-hydroxychromene-2-carboxylate isomerase
MPAPIEFYFDFTSPYSYLASEQIDDLAARHGRTVDYRPTLLGAAFRVSGQRPLPEIPLKGDYSRRDIARSARYAGIAFALPDPFPIATVQAARACLVLQSQYPALATAYIHGVFRAYFVQGRNITEPAVLRAVLCDVMRDVLPDGSAGAPADAVLAATAGEAVKQRLKEAVDASIARGVFGAPYFIVDGEPFWGHDRLAHIERWLQSGPF